MTPKLYRNDATSFDNLGFGALTHSLSCIIKEEIGVAPTLEMSLLMDDPLFVEVEVGNIIVAEPNKSDPNQAFVIEEITKPVDGVVTIYATHIAQHRGKLIPVAPFSASNLDEALSLMVSSSLEDNPFTLARDPNKNNVVASMNPTVPHSFRELMGGVEGSILDTYRGEWKYDNFTLTLYNKRGRDNGVRVMYGRNMSDFKLEEQFNWDNSATGVIGYWVDSESGTTVIGDIQYSDYADLYPYKKTVCMDFSDKWQSAPSVTDLNTYALSWINGKGLYGASVTVAFEHLNVEGGADIGLGDTVHIFNGTYNFEMESRIVGLEYDVLAEEYTSVTIGEQKTTLNEAIADIGGGTTSSGGGASVDPSTSLPLMDGTAAIGTEQTYARGDHVHPTDTSRVAKSGDTMTGKLKTAWGNSWGHFVMNGSGQAVAHTVPDLAEEMRYSSGAVGSVNITTAYTLNGITVRTGWYNFAYIPHRSGGNVGQADGDNQNYGQLILIGMTIYRGQEYIISISGGSVVDIKRTVSQWTTFKTDNLAVSSSVTSLSLEGYNYNEILVEVGQVNGSQIYGGTSAILVKDANHPTFVNWATGGQTVPFIFYAYQHGDVLDIRNVNGVNSTCRYRISLR